MSISICGRDQCILSFAFLFLVHIISHIHGHNEVIINHRKI